MGTKVKEMKVAEDKALANYQEETQLDYCDGNEQDVANGDAIFDGWYAVLSPEASSGIAVLVKMARSRMPYVGFLSQQFVYGAEKQAKKRYYKMECSCCPAIVRQGGQARQHTGACSVNTKRIFIDNWNDVKLKLSFGGIGGPENPPAQMKIITG